MVPDASKQEPRGGLAGLGGAGPHKSISGSLSKMILILHGWWCTGPNPAVRALEGLCSRGARIRSGKVAWVGIRDFKICGAMGASYGVMVLSRRCGVKSDDGVHDCGGRRLWWGRVVVPRLRSQIDLGKIRVYFWVEIRAGNGPFSCILKD